MKHRWVVLSLFLAAANLSAQFPSQIKRVVVIVQENRTPDNLFHFLTPACPLPSNPTPQEACSPVVSTSCYDIAPCGLSNQSGKVLPVPLQPVGLADNGNPNHSYTGFSQMCDPDPATLKCRNDGAWKTSNPNGYAYAYVSNPAVTNTDGSAGHLLDPYLMMAKQYGWANFMYQTNQGPSYPAHQFLFAGTSAITATDDANSTFIAENAVNQPWSAGSGCLAPKGELNYVISPALSTPAAGCKVFADGSIQECPVSNSALVYPTQPVGTYCSDHRSIADVLDPRKISWKYYAPTPDSFWTAPDAIKNICQPAFANPNGTPSSKLVCTGAEWAAHVDVANRGTDVLRDIQNCDLANVTWVIPDGDWSDHAALHDQYGPSWVAAVVNAIGTHPTCAAGTKDAGQTYWNNTAIVVTWDDWGGWSDNQPPPYISALPCRSLHCQGDYQYGFRVPLIVISAYTQAAYINNYTHDFGSILRMIEGINHIPEGSIGFADKRATTDLIGFFSLTKPRPYRKIPAAQDASFFLSQTGAAVDPDDD